MFACMCVHALFWLAVQDVGQLRRDVSFAQHVLRADYENRLSERATEL